MYQRWWFSLAFSIALVAASIYFARPAHSADAVMCVNCGSEITQLANKLTMLKQLANQAQQLKTQISQYDNMITNSKGVSQNVWGNAMGDLQRINALFQNSKALAYSAKSLDAQFANRYQGYKGYLSGKVNLQNKYQQWSQEANDNALYALKAAGAQNMAFQDENALMQQLQAMSGSAEGRMQAMQIANMMAAQNIQQIQKLRQLLMAQLQMQANYYQLQKDKEDAAEAAHARFVKATPVSETDGRKF